MVISPLPHRRPGGPPAVLRRARAGAARWRAPLLGALGLAATAMGCEPRASVVIIGHRGAPLRAPENSLASFQRAAEQQADGIELDVVLTADGEHIVMHDDTLDRTTSCSGPVAERSLADLDSCRLGNDEPIRTLEEMLTLIPDPFRYLFVEVKVNGSPIEQADAVVDTVRRSRWTDRCIITSFSPTVIDRVLAHRVPGLRASWDHGAGSGIEGAADRHLPFYLAGIEDLEPQEGTVGEGLGIDVVAYGVVTLRQFDLAYDHGIRFMMTDSVIALREMAGLR